MKGVVGRVAGVTRGLLPLIYPHTVSHNPKFPSYEEMLTPF